MAAISYNSYGQFRPRGPVLRRFPERRIVVQAPVRRLEQIKENYIARRLNLTADQARSFWPLYRQYVQDQTAIRVARRDNLQTSPNGTEQARKDLAYETELVNVRKHYLDEFMAILPPDKVNELYQAEREFTDEMVRQLSERSIRAGN